MTREHSRIRTVDPRIREGFWLTVTTPRTTHDVVPWRRRAAESEESADSLEGKEDEVKNWKWLTEATIRIED